MKKRQMEFIACMLQKKEIECLLLTGKVDVKKSRGRPRHIYFQSIAQDLGILRTESNHAANDRAQ